MSECGEREYGGEEEEEEGGEEEEEEGGGRGGGGRGKSRGGEEGPGMPQESKAVASTISLSYSSG